MLCSPQIWPYLNVDRVPTVEGRRVGRDIADEVLSSEPTSSPTYRHAANDAIATTALKAEKYKNCTGWRKFISYHTDRSSSVI